MGGSRGGLGGAAVGWRLGPRREGRLQRRLGAIHPSAWKGNSKKFAGTEFSEVAPAREDAHPRSFAARFNT
jgi:hypothetical protein